MLILYIFNWKQKLKLFFHEIYTYKTIKVSRNEKIHKYLKNNNNYCFSKPMTKPMQKKKPHYLKVKTETLKRILKKSKRVTQEKKKGYPRTPLKI